MYFWNAKAGFNVFKYSFINTFYDNRPFKDIHQFDVAQNGNKFSITVIEEYLVRAVLPNPTSSRHAALHVLDDFLI